MRLDAPAIIPAQLTPYGGDGSVDHGALRAHAEWLLEHGADGLMPCGSTGETALLTDDEVVEVTTTVVAAVGGRGPVIAHVGRPSTRATADLGARALEAGAAAVSAVVPYYHPLEPDQVVDHYRALIDELGGARVVAYSIPTQSNNVLGADELGTLAAEGLAGFKDSTMSAERHDAYAAAVRAAGREDFRLFTGSSAMLLRSLRQGGSGGVLGIANLHPGLCAALRDAFVAGDDARAEELQAQLAEATAAASGVPVLKRETSERLRAETGVDFSPELRAPYGRAGRPVAGRA